MPGGLAPAPEKWSQMLQAHWFSGGPLSCLPSLVWLMISYLDGDLRRQVGRQTAVVISILDYILLPFLWLINLSGIPLELGPRSKEFEFICLYPFFFPFVSFWMRQAVKTMNHSFSFIKTAPNEIKMSFIQSCFFWNFIFMITTCIAFERIFFIITRKKNTKNPLSAINNKK